MMKGILGGVKENSVPRAARASEVRAGIRVTREKQVMAAGTARGATPASGTADEDHSNKQPPQSNGCMPRSESPCQDAIGQQVDRDAAPKNAMGYKCEGPGGQTPIRRRSRATDLLKGLQRSLQQPGAAVHPDDFHFEEPEHAATPAQGAEVAGTGPAEPPYACRDAGHLLETVVSSALPAGCVSKDCASEADTDCGQQPSEAPSSPQVPSACPSSAPLAMHEPEVDGRGPGKPGRYRTVKGKFKPRPVETKAVPVNVSQELSSVKPALPVAQIGHAAAGQPRDSSARAPSVHVTGTTPTLPDSTASTDVLDATPSARKRVAFGSCQMYEFDPERPPADGGEDDCVCEVPLLPEAASSPLPGLPNNFMNAPDCAGVGHLWNAGASAEEVTHNHDPHVCLLARCGAVEGVSGVIERTVCGGTCPTVPEHESGHRGPASCSQTMQEPQGAVTERAGPVAGTKAVAADRGEHDEVTPVLYFDVHAHKSGGSLEGALRVTTAEALQLSEQDLAEMQAELESGHRLAAQEALDVQVRQCPLHAAAQPVGSGGGDGQHTTRPNPHSNPDSPRRVQGEDAESSDGDDGESSEVEGAGERLPLEHPRRPRLRQRRSGAEAAEVAQDSLSAEQQHQMNQQAVADAFRYTTTPKANYIAQRSGALRRAAQCIASSEASSCAPRNGALVRRCLAPDSQPAALMCVGTTLLLRPGGWGLRPAGVPYMSLLLTSLTACPHASSRVGLLWSLSKASRVLRPQGALPLAAAPAHAGGRALLTAPKQESWQRVWAPATPQRTLQLVPMRRPGRARLAHRQVGTSPTLTTIPLLRAGRRRVTTVRAVWRARMTRQKTHRGPLLKNTTHQGTGSRQTDTLTRRRLPSLACLSLVWRGVFLASGFVRLQSCTCTDQMWSPITASLSTPGRSAPPDAQSSPSA